MKILHIIDTFSYGGAQILLKGLLERQKDWGDNFHHHLFVLRRTRNEIPNKLTTITFSICRNKFCFFSFLELIFHIKKHKPDIVHCHLQKSIILGVFIKLLLKKKKLIIHEHGTILQKNNAVYIKVLKKFIKKVDLLIAVSTAIEKKQKVLLTPTNQQCLKIANYINIDKYKFIHKEKKLTSFTLGYLGRLNKVKGVDILLKSLLHVKQKTHLLIAGDGPERKVLTEIAQRCDLHKVEFLGMINNPSDFFKRIDLIIIPSRHESFGLVALEAMASGVPVIASDVDGLREMVKHERTGLLFETESITALSDCLNKILQQGYNFDNIRQHAREFSLQFSFKNYIKKLNEAYLSVLV